MPKPAFIALPKRPKFTDQETRQRAREFLELMQTRRTVRDFSDRPIPDGIIKDCLRAAGSAPSGANQQPWHFVVIQNPAIKQRIRQAAEAEEIEFYSHRAPPEWLKALEPLGTDANKPFLETAPVLIAIFVQSYGLLPDGKRVKHYYAHESVGISVGILLTALHYAGLATLTHTPSPMNFLNEILDRPVNEKPYLLLVTGYPAETAMVPKISKKTLDEMATFR